MSKLMFSFMDSKSNVTTTANGAYSYRGTGNDNLNLFGRIGSMRTASEDQILSLFKSAVNEDHELALRIMLWTRDCRGGAGERRAFRIMAKYVEAHATSGFIEKLIDKTVELGRWDDLFVFEKNFKLVVAKIAKGIAEDNKLMLKWLPREKSAKKNIARRLMIELNMSPKQYRKLCTGVVTTETLMCAKRWSDINLSHVPSLAAARYQKAFAAKVPSYNEWKNGLKTGETKINMSVAYPYSVWNMCKQGVDLAVVDAAWKSLPNYLPEGVNILPIADTSSSMTCSAGGNISCLDVSISLGMYLATKNTGVFKNALITFNSTPEFHYVGNGTAGEELRRVFRMPWGGSTNFQATFDMILYKAIGCNASQEDMPQYVVCLSDMQFNQAEGYNGYSCCKKTNFQAIKEKFKRAGYVMPTLIFWNLNGQYDNVPVLAEDSNTMFVSGFSPAIMKGVLNNSFNDIIPPTPLSAMLDVIMDDRYGILK